MRRSWGLGVLLCGSALVAATLVVPVGASADGATEERRLAAAAPTSDPRSPSKLSWATLSGAVGGKANKRVAMQRKVDGRWRSTGFEDVTRRGGRFQIGYTMGWSKALLRVKVVGANAATDSLTVRALSISDKPWSGTISFDYSSGFDSDGPPGHGSHADDVAEVTLDGTGVAGDWIQPADATGSVDRFYGDAVDNGCTMAEQGAFTHDWRVGLVMNYGMNGVSDFMDTYVGGEAPSQEMAAGVTWTRTCPGGTETAPTELYDVVQTFDPGTNSQQTGVCAVALEQGLFKAFEAKPKTYAGTTAGSASKTVVDESQGLTRSCAVSWQLTREHDADHDGLPD